MNGNTPKFKLINCVGDKTYVQAGKLYLSAGVEEPASTIPGFDGRARMLEEHCLWKRRRVDADVLRKPGWFSEYLAEIDESLRIELSDEEAEGDVIADFEVVRLNYTSPARYGEALAYMRESLAAVRRRLTGRGRLGLYDLPYQDHPGADEGYLAEVMPEILSIVDFVTSLLYLPGPGWGLAELRGFIRANIQRSMKHARGKPVYPLIWDGYVETDKGPLLNVEHEIIFDECDRAGLRNVMVWDVNRGADDRKRIATLADFLRRVSIAATRGALRKAGEASSAA